MTTTKSTNYTYQITIIGILFAVFGFVTWLNSTLIQYLKIACQLNDQQAYYVATAFFAAYFFIALPSSWILNKVGTKTGMMIGLLIMALGAIIFIPGAQSRSYPVFLTGLFTVGTGLALLQTAANPYVTIIGPIESAASRISIMGLCNKGAGIIANLSFGFLLLKNSDALQKQIDAAEPMAKAEILNGLASRVVTPYIFIAIALVIIAIVIKRSNLPDIKEESNAEDTAMSRGKTSTLQFPHLILGAFAIFFYVGAEVMAGDLIGIYGKNLGFSEDTSKYFTTLGLIGLIVGYLTSIVLIPKYIKQETWLYICAILSIILSIASYFVGDYAAVVCLALLGFTNAVMWPAIFPLGINSLGRFTNVGSAIMIMGIVGGAIIPPLYGWLYKEGNPFGFTFRSAFLVVMCICYLYILWFGRSGHKVGFDKVS